MSVNVKTNNGLTTIAGNVSGGSDTTYTFTGGTNGFTATPSVGQAQVVNITPSIANATQSTNGLMSSTDKTKLDGIITSGTTDLTEGTSPLATGTLYCYYEV